MVTLQRCRGVDAAAGQLIVREAGGFVSFTDLRRSARRAAGRHPQLPPRRRALRADAARARGDPPVTVIDWILAEKIAGYVAGSGDAATATRGSPGAGGRIREAGDRLHRAGAGPPAATPGGNRPARVGRRPTSRRCARCWTRCWTAPATAWDRCKPAGQAGARRRGHHRGRRSCSATWPSACSASTSSCCSTTREVTTPPRLLFVLPNLGHAVRSFERPGGRVHDLGGAARGHPRGPVRGRPVAARPRGRPGPGAAAQRRAAHGSRAQAAHADPGARSGAPSSRCARATSSRSSPAMSSARRSTGSRP